MRKTSDQLIDQTLTALRDTTPPTGMERRILHAVEHRAATTHTRHPWTWSLTTAALLLSVAAFTLHHLTTNPGAPGPASGTRVSIPSTKLALNSQLTARSSQLDAKPALSSNTQTLSSLTTSKLKTHNSTKPALPNPTPNPDHLLCDCDPIALAESRAPSQPAPPLPLTDQEKLLRRIVHKGDPVELAELNAEARAAHTDADKAAFQSFFHPPVKEPTE